MRRREALKTATGAFALGAIGWPLLSQSSPYRPLDSISVPQTKEVVVGPDGDTAFVAATTGFVTVDISSPEDLSILAERRNLLSDHEDGPLRSIWDVKVDGDRLIVAGPANPLPGTVYGFLLYDVSDPANPERLAVYETDFPIHNCFIENGLVYLTGNDGDRNPLVIVDVSDGSPEELGRWSVVDHDERWENVHRQLRWLHDVWVQDGVAYLAHWDAGTWLIDVSDPTHPEYVTDIRSRSHNELASIPAETAPAENLELPGNDHYVTVNDDASILGIGKEAWDTDSTTREGGPAGIELWDITDPETPEQLSTLSPPEPTNTTGTKRTSNTAGFGINDGLQHMGCHDCGQEASGLWTTAHNFDIVDDRLFSSWYGGGVKIHDISDPLTPDELAWWRQPDETSFWSVQLATAPFFVASSTDSKGRSSNGTGGVYTFPNEAGQQPNSPQLTQPANKR